MSGDPRFEQMLAAFFTEEVARGGWKGDGTAEEPRAIAAKALRDEGWEPLVAAAGAFILHPVPNLQHQLECKYGDRRKAISAYFWRDRRKFGANRDARETYVKNTLRLGFLEAELSDDVGCFLGFGAAEKHLNQGLSILEIARGDSRAVRLALFPDPHEGTSQTADAGVDRQPGDAICHASPEVSEQIYEDERQSCRGLFDADGWTVEMKNRAVLAIAAAFLPPPGAPSSRTAALRGPAADRQAALKAAFSLLTPRIPSEYFATRFFLSRQYSQAIRELTHIPEAADELTVLYLVYCRALAIKHRDSRVNRECEQVLPTYLSRDIHFQFEPNEIRGLGWIVVGLAAADIQSLTDWSSSVCAGAALAMNPLVGIKAQSERFKEILDHWSTMFSRVLGHFASSPWEGQLYGNGQRIKALSERTLLAYQGIAEAFGEESYLDRPERQTTGRVIELLDEHGDTLPDVRSNVLGVVPEYDLIGSDADGTVVTTGTSAISPESRYDARVLETEGWERQLVEAAAVVFQPIQDSRHDADCLIRDRLRVISTDLWKDRSRCGGDRESRRGLVEKSLDRGIAIAASVGDDECASRLCNARDLLRKSLTIVETTQEMGPPSATASTPAVIEVAEGTEQHDDSDGDDESKQTVEEAPRTLDAEALADYERVRKDHEAMLAGHGWPEGARRRASLVQAGPLLAVESTSEDWYFSLCHLRGRARYPIEAYRDMPDIGDVLSLLLLAQYRALAALYGASHLEVACETEIGNLLDPQGGSSLMPHVGDGSQPVLGGDFVIRWSQGSDPPVEFCIDLNLAVFQRGVLAEPSRDFQVQMRDWTVILMKAMYHLRDCPQVAVEVCDRCLGAYRGIAEAMGEDDYLAETEGLCLQRIECEPPRPSMWASRSAGRRPDVRSPDTPT